MRQSLCYVGAGDSGTSGNRGKERIRYTDSRIGETTTQCAAFRKVFGCD